MASRAVYDEIHCARNDRFLRSDRIMLMTYTHKCRSLKRNHATRCTSVLHFAVAVTGEPIGSRDHSWKFNRHVPTPCILDTRPTILTRAPAHRAFVRSQISEIKGFSKRREDKIRPVCPEVGGEKEKGSGNPPSVIEKKARSCPIRFPCEKRFRR